MQPVMILRADNVFVMFPPEKVPNAILTYHGTRNPIQNISQTIFDKFRFLRGDILNQNNRDIRNDLATRPSNGHTIVSTGVGNIGKISSSDTTYRIDHQTGGVYNVHYQAPSPGDESSSYAVVNAHDNAELFDENIRVKFLVAGLHKSLFQLGEYRFRYKIDVIYFNANNKSSNELIKLIYKYASDNFVNFKDGQLDPIKHQLNTRQNKGRKYHDGARKRIQEALEKSLNEKMNIVDISLLDFFVGLFCAAEKIHRGGQWDSILEEFILALQGNLPGSKIAISEVVNIDSFIECIKEWKEEIHIEEKIDNEKEMFLDKKLFEKVNGLSDTICDDSDFFDCSENKDNFFDDSCYMIRGRIKEILIYTDVLSEISQKIQRIAGIQLCYERGGEGLLHGNKGEKCRRVVLNEEEYITKISVGTQPFINCLSYLKLKTSSGKAHSFGLKQETFSTFSRKFNKNSTLGAIKGFTSKEGNLVSIGFISNAVLKDENLFGSEVDIISSNELQKNSIIERKITHLSDQWNKFKQQNYSWINILDEKITFVNKSRDYTTYPGNRLKWRGKSKNFKNEKK